MICTSILSVYGFLLYGKYNKNTRVKEEIYTKSEERMLVLMGFVLIITAVLVPVDLVTNIVRLLSN